MKYAEFRKKLEAKFPFKKGEVKLLGGDVLVHVSSRGVKTQLRGFNGTSVKNPKSHFAATAIMDSPGPDEIIHITEPGAYFDHVFWLDHEELYSLEDLSDLDTLLEIIGYDEDQYNGMTGEERIEAMPFVKEKLANSLETFFKEIRVMSKEEFLAKGKAKPKSAKAKPAAKAKAGKATALKYKKLWDHVNNIYMLSKNGKQYTYVHIDGPSLDVVTGNIGGRRKMKSTKYGDADKAMRLAESYLDKMLAAGYKFVKKI